VDKETLWYYWCNKANLYNKRAGGGNGDIFDSLDDNRQNNQEEKSE